MNLKDLRQANIDRQKEWGGDDKIDTLFRVVETAGEFGELAEACKKYTRAQRGIDGALGDLTAIKEELGDCVIALDLLATSFGIDLGECVPMKFNKTSTKYGFNTKL